MISAKPRGRLSSGALEDGVSTQPQRSIRFGRISGACFSVGLALLLSPPVGDAAELIDGIAAQVGAEVVLISEVSRIANPVEARMRAAGAPDVEIKKMKAEVLDSLIENRLLDITAQLAEVEAEPDEIESAMEGIAAENGITLATLRRSVEAQGLEFATYRAKIGQEIVRQKLLGGMLGGKVKIDEAKVRALYDERYGKQRQGGSEVHAYHLIVEAVEPKGWAIDIACEEATERATRIANGEDFLTVARETTPTNPDLGWTHEEELASWMRASIEGLGAGALSEVTRLNFGCSLLKLIERREAKTVAFEEVRRELEGELFDREVENESSDFFDSLRKQTYIEKKGVFAGPSLLEMEPQGAR